MGERTYHMQLLQVTNIVYRLSCRRVGPGSKSIIYSPVSLHIFDRLLNNLGYLIYRRRSFCSPRQDNLA